MATAPTLPPRHLLRRLLALVVDCAIASLVTTLILLPFHDPGQNGLRLGGLISSTSCGNATSVTQEIADLIAPKPINRAIVCRHWENGIENGRSVTVVFDEITRKDGAVTYSSHKTLMVDIDDQNNIITTFRPQGVLTLALLLFGSAALLARGRATPGKRLAGLMVAGGPCALCREFRRWGPLLVLALAGMIISLLGSSVLLGFIGGGLVPFLLGIALLFALLAYYYLWPFLRWRGGARYDLASGFEVVRASRQDTQT